MEESRISSIHNPNYSRIPDSDKSQDRDTGKGCNNSSSNWLGRTLQVLCPCLRKTGGVETEKQTVDTSGKQRRATWLRSSSNQNASDLHRTSCARGSTDFYFGRSFIKANEEDASSLEPLGNAHTIFSFTDHNKGYKRKDAPPNVQIISMTGSG